MSDTASAAPRVPKRVAAVILNSLKGGVVPRIGLPYITVGRDSRPAHRFESHRRWRRELPLLSRSLRRRQELLASDHPNACHGRGIRRR